MSNDCLRNRKRHEHDVFPVYGDVDDDKPQSPWPAQAEERRGPHGEIIQRGLDDELTRLIGEADDQLNELLRFPEDADYRDDKGNPMSRAEWMERYALKDGQGDGY